MTPVMPLYPLMFKAVTIDLVLVYLLATEERVTAISNLTGLLECNALDLRISKVLDLADCAKAHNIIDAGERVGSVILKV
jgi:NADPH2:quinone reductase